MSAIGDTVLTLPVACALRERFPNAYIGWVVEQKSSAMVLGHPSIDEVFTVPRGWFLSRKKRRSLQQDLRACAFTHSVDCQGTNKSALAGWLSGAKTRIGCRGKYGTEFSTYMNNTLVLPRHPHLTDRSLELLEPLGIVNPTVDWRLPTSSEADASVSEILRDLGIGRPFAIINPGATWDSKLWEMDRFAAVSRHLAKKRQMNSLVVWGNNVEKSLAYEIASQSDGHAMVAPRTSLHELVALLRHGTLFVSSDTGPLHMSVAVGTPSVGLYGATRPADCGPYGSPHIGIQVRFQSGSRRQRRLADNSAMREISVERVCHECDQLLNKTVLQAA